jgi:hypothetical protein
MNALPLLLASSLLAASRAEIAYTMAPSELWRRPAEPAEQPLEFGTLVPPVVKTVGRTVDEWLGTATQVGTTYTELQQNGSLGRLLAVSSDGVVHGAYSGGTNSTDGRRAYAWCVDDMTVYNAPITNVTSAYTTAATTGPEPANGQAANTGVASCYVASPLRSWICSDFGGCTLAFDMRWQPGQALIAPHVAVDANDKYHLVTTGSHTGPTPDCSYYLSSANGRTWDAATPVQLTTDVRVQGAIPVASNHSQRAAVIYLQRTGPEDIAADETGELGGQLHQDLLAYVSNTGNLLEEITGNEPTNLTAFGPGSQAPFGEHGCRAYANVDGLFTASVEPELHLVYSAAVMFDDTFRVDSANGDSLVFAYYQYARDRGQIWHLNTETQVWSLVAGSNAVHPGSSDNPPVQLQAFRGLTDRPQIAQDPQTGFLYVIWSQHDRNDLSAAGYPNGEILARCSADYGATWGPAVNLSNTPSPDCPPGGCDAEDWASMAPLAVDGQLHLTFIHDRDAGIAASGQGSETLNPVIHLQVPVTDIPPHDGIPWNTQGRVGLVHERRIFDWFCSAWEGEDAILDQARIEEPVYILNESTFPVQVAGIEFHHHPTDLLGRPRGSGPDGTGSGRTRRRTMAARRRMGPLAAGLENHPFPGHGGLEWTAQP